MWRESWLPVHGDAVDELPEPYVQLPAMKACVRASMLAELPTLAPLFSVRLPPTTRLGAVIETFCERQRFPTTYNRLAPETLLFSVSSHVLPVWVANM